MSELNHKNSLKSAEERKEERQVSADALVADLLNVVKQSDQPFSMDDVVEDLKKHKKHSKDKKHKKKKSKKSRDKDRSRSPSRERRSRKRETEKGSPSRRKRKSGSSTAPDDNKKNKTPTYDKISSEDDLPLGADFHIIKPAKSLEKENGAQAQTSSEPIKEKDFLPPVRSDKDKKEHSPSPPLVKPEILKLDINEKIKGEMVPRVIKKIAIGKLSLPVAKEEVKKKEEPSEEKAEDLPSASTIPLPSTGPSITTKPIATETNGETTIPKAEAAESTVSGLVTDDVSEGSIPEDVKTGTAIKKRELKHSTRRRSVSSSSDASNSTGEKMAQKAAKGRGKRLQGMHSERSGGDGKSSRKRPPVSSSRKEKSRRSRSRSTSRKRARRSRSRSRSRSTKRRRSKSRSRSRSHGRRRSRSPRNNRGTRRKDERDRKKEDESARGEKIDKGKLLAIAKKKARLLQQMGIMTSAGEPTAAATISGKSIDELVEYCQRVSKREEKEAQRKHGEDVSSDSEFEDFMANVKHPYAVNTTQTLGGITINIGNAVPLPIRSVQERMLDESTLRLCYPVSSGAIHKDKTESEWTPVEKEIVPVTVTNAVKQHKAVTSLQAEEAKKQGNPIVASPLIPPPPVPPSFESLLTGPGAPPSFVEPLLPPPPLPPMFVPAPEDKIIIKSPKKLKREAPTDVSKVLATRAAAMQRLEADPNDYEARQTILECDEDMQAWAAQSQGSVPGKFTGSTGVRTLSADELQPHDPRFHAWVKKDQFKIMKPLTTGVGLRLMQKMGWRPGEGLGKDRVGDLEPLQLDVKFDRKGLAASTEQRGKKGGAVFQPNQISGQSDGAAWNPPDLAGRNPISLLMEFAAKRRMAPPQFRFIEEGPPSMKRFNCAVVVNGVEYVPALASAQKKQAKTACAQVALQALGLIRADPSVQ